MKRTPSPSCVQASCFNPTDTRNHPSSGTRILKVRRVPTDGATAMAFLVSPLIVTSSTAKTPGVAGRLSAAANRSMSSTAPEPPPLPKSHQPRISTATTPTAINSERLPFIRPIPPEKT